MRTERDAFGNRGDGTTSQARVETPVEGTGGLRYGSAYQPASTKTAEEIESLGVSLGPSLHEACGDRLGEIEWFRSPWQRSGAATGFTSWRLPDGSVIEAIAKAPVGWREYFWTTSLGATDPMRWGDAENAWLPVPRVLAGGIELGGYEVAWLILERAPGKPVSAMMSRRTLSLMMLAAARFAKLADEILPVSKGSPAISPDWARLLARARESCEDNHLADEGRWLGAMDRVEARLERLVAVWDARPLDSWCHGDLHPGNVMMRHDIGPEHADCGVLLDLAMVHTGHWIEDALYLERLHWGREEMLCGINPVAELASRRRELGLHVDQRWNGSSREPGVDLICDVRRALMAATSPAFLAQERDSVYLGAALERLERLIGSCSDSGGSLAL